MERASIVDEESVFLGYKKNNKKGEERRGEGMKKKGTREGGN